jgi:hypothetical protein
MSELGDYVDRMRQRHPRLSMRRMSLEAGLSASIVGAIIRAGQGARPCALKALADRWGSDEDYCEMMRLAGHPIVRPSAHELGAEARELLDLFERLPPGDQRAVLILTRALLEQHFADDDKACKE